MKEHPQRKQPIPVTGSGVKAIVRKGLSAPPTNVDSESLGPLGKRFQFDFNNVRIHAGPQAAASARALGARAYAVGEHIVVAPAVERPAASNPLLVHELSHVVQQARRSNTSEHLLVNSPIALQRDADPSLPQPQVVRDVGQMSKFERFVEVLKYAGGELGPELYAKLKTLATPEAVATMAAFGTAWVAAQFFGIGEAADLLLGAVGFALLGPDIKKVLEDTYELFKLWLFPSDEGDLKRAGHDLAQIVAIVGIDGAIIFLFHRGMKRAGPAIRAAGESARAPSAVTPEGVRIPVPNEPAPTEPLQSRGGGSKSEGETRAPKEESPKNESAGRRFWNRLKAFRGKTKTNGESGKGRRFYELDRTHGDIEVYDANGRHLGSADAETGSMTKPAVPGRRIDL